MKKKKIALITGITGQDGSYLARFLLKKNYEVHRIKRRSSSLNTWRIDDLYSDPLKNRSNFFLHHGDMTDSLSLQKVIHKKFRNVPRSTDNKRPAVSQRHSI